MPITQQQKHWPASQGQSLVGLFYKLDPCKKVPPDFDPERQANVFAAELLAPIDLIGGLSEREIGSRCGVSYQIAKRQLRVLERIRLRKEGKRRAKKRRPSSKA